MGIYGVGQVERVAAVVEGDAPRAAAPVQVAVVGLAPRAAPSADNGLARPQLGVSAARPLVTNVATDQDAALLEIARAHFVRARPAVVAAFHRLSPELAAPALDELADEWVARSMRRYSALLDGRHDGMQELTPAALLLTIAYEGRRPAQDPVRVAAEALEAKFIATASVHSSTEEGTYEVRTTGARFSRSTAGWETERK